MPSHPKANATIATRRWAAWLIAGIFIAFILLIALLWRPWQPTPFNTLHPHTQKVMRQLGIEPGRVVQGLGSAPASAGIHGSDGSVEGRPYCAAFDLSVSDLTPHQTRSLLHKLRSAGLVCWWRIPGVSFPVATALGAETGPHIHGIDPFIPHKRRLEMQIRDYIDGNNGIEIGRYAHRPDPAAADPQTLAERSLLRREGSIWHLQQARQINPIITPQDRHIRLSQTTL